MGRRLTVNSASEAGLDRITGEFRNDPEKVGLKREIGLLGGVTINVGNIIGSGVFLTPKGVFMGVGSVGASLVIWAISGLFSMLGALCFAELGLSIPSSGGHYAYIKAAFGDLLSFLYIWISMVMMLPAQQAVICMVFAQYLLETFLPAEDPCYIAYISPPTIILCNICVVTVMYVNCRSVKLATSVQSVFTVAKLAALSIIIISGLVLLAKVLVTLINAISVRWSSWLQDVTSFCKVGALLIIIISGMVELGRGNTQNFENSFEGTEMSGLGVALYSGLFSYAGWYSLNIVVEELKDPYKNLPRAIVITIVTVTIVYVLTNIAYFAALSPEELLASNAVAVTYGAKVLGSFAWVMPVSVALSTFGSANGNMLTCSRLFFVGAREKHLPNLLSMINIERNTPVPSLLFTSLLTILYSLAGDVFTLINYFNFVTWFSSGLAVAGLIWLRYKEPDRPRPYKVNILLPIIFVLACIFLIVMGTIAAPIDTLIGVAIMCTGIPVYFFIVRPKKKPECVVKANDFVTRWFQKLMFVVAEER